MQGPEAPRGFTRTAPVHLQPCSEKGKKDKPFVTTEVSNPSTKSQPVHQGWRTVKKSAIGSKSLRWAGQVPSCTATCLSALPSFQAPAPSPGPGLPGFRGEGGWREQGACCAPS